MTRERSKHLLLLHHPERLMLRLDREIVDGKELGIGGSKVLWGCTRVSRQVLSTALSAWFDPERCNRRTPVYPSKSPRLGPTLVHRHVSHTSTSSTNTRNPVPVRGTANPCRRGALLAFGLSSPRCSSSPPSRTCRIYCRHWHLAHWIVRGQRSTDTTTACIREPGWPPTDVPSLPVQTYWWLQLLLESCCGVPC